MASKENGNILLAQKFDINANDQPRRMIFAKTIDLKSDESMLSSVVDSIYSWWYQQQPTPEPTEIPQWMAIMYYYNTQLKRVVYYLQKYDQQSDNWYIVCELIMNIRKREIDNIVFMGLKDTKSMWVVELTWKDGEYINVCINAGDERGMHYERGYVADTLRK